MNPFDWSRFDTLGGLDIMEVEPRIENVVGIRPGFQWCTDATRRRINAELREMFGTRDVTPVAKGMTYMLYNRYVVIRNDDLLLFRCSVTA